MKWRFDRIGYGSLDAKDAKLLASLEAQFDEDPGNFIERSKSPNAKDFQLIGTIVQVYCFAELSARQIIDLIEDATPGAKKHAASRLAAHDVFPKLEEAAKRIVYHGNGNLQETLLRASHTIGMHRELRHTLAHWVVRRVANGAAYLLLSKNAQEGKRRHGKASGFGETHYGIFGVATMRRELAKLEQHTHNLSLLAVEMSRDPEMLARMLGGPDGNRHKSDDDL